MVGDPSGKSETRPALTKEQVAENAQSYFDQMSKVLDVSKAEVVNNADWLHKMSFTDLLKLAAQVTVAQMMTRDDFAKRYADGRPIAIHEFFYPLMQAYDSVEIDSDIELGGTTPKTGIEAGRPVSKLILPVTIKIFHVEYSATDHFLSLDPLDTAPEINQYDLPVNIRESDLHLIILPRQVQRRVTG